MATDQSTLDRIRSDLDTDRIRSWQSIVTLIVFVVTNIIVLFPFHIPIFIPRRLHDAVLDALAAVRVIPPRSDQTVSTIIGDGGSLTVKSKSSFVRLDFPMNFLTGPIIADLFLLAILAIGRDEVAAGTVGANHIHPIDIMLFFITLAYIAISIDASGLIRYMAFKVLQWGGKVGHRLFFYLYAFFFGLGSFIGNDPIILSGTAFLAYMTRVSSNIVHPRAWIYTQFAIANIASAILVSSNPTNLVLAGAFSIRFIDYTANMIVPVVITAIVLFPFLLYIVFANEELIPSSIKMHELPPEARNKAPINPNIPNARGVASESEELEDNERGQLLSLEEIMNPFLDKKGATAGAVIMAVTLITVLSVNAAMSSTGQELPVFYITVPAAVLMLCWDLAMGWMNRHETRAIARQGRQDIEDARAQRGVDGGEQSLVENSPPVLQPRDSNSLQIPTTTSAKMDNSEAEDTRSSGLSSQQEKQDLSPAESTPNGILGATLNEYAAKEKKKAVGDVEKRMPSPVGPQESAHGSARKPTLVSKLAEAQVWAQETFPTVMAVMAHLPFALVPFAFAMFVLVQALVSSGWVPVFAYGWDHWVEKTGTVGAIGGMGFLSVVLCNFSGTNIGTTILLCRVIQAWRDIHVIGDGAPITDRTFWATVYSMALGVNYGAFSTAFSASLAGLLWRDILERKHIEVPALEFARVNLPIIAVSMVVGCVVLVGEVYIMRTEDPYVVNSF